ncbi:elongation factor G [Aureisphaera galaxeae]|uniref:elongation factor G n=1 Tax=Aureisphaera galaxeae TaxID=1538023 RepID=UPI0023508807|nr:elongation factor G [Aureisphaera galaxeae]MDC8005000.1 elongation factor G [Aureisphaera galaxeae]
MKRTLNLRNIGIIAHVDAGKTTVTERMLYYTGLTHKLGNVDDGNTVTDSDPQEAKRGITISSSAVSTQWQLNDQLYDINIIDTPGHVDFAVEVERSLRVLDGAIAIFCGASGVQSQSESVWMQSDKYGVPKIGFINKMDRIGADFEKTVQQIEATFGIQTLVLQIPIGSGDEFEGIIDIVSQKAMYWNTSDAGNTWTSQAIPDGYVQNAEEHRNQLLEQIAGYDDVFMEAFLEELPITEEMIHDAIRRITLERSAIPILCGSAFKNIGVQPLLDAVSRYLPSPLDLDTVEGYNPEENIQQTRNRNEDEVCTAFAFKVLTNKYVGTIAMVRIYAGSIIPGSFLLNPRTGKKERISRIIRIQADKMDEMSRAVAGDICGLIGVKNVTTGDTLTELNAPFVLEAIQFPDPVISLAIEPKAKNDEKKFGEALAKIASEDPSLQVKVDPQTGQTLLLGMGELHLEVRLELLRSQFGLDVNQGDPKVSYREQLTSTVTHREVFKKQSGGDGQYADISFEIGPRDDAEKGLLFINEIKGGVIPKEFISNVEKGFIQAMKNGVLLGYPVESMKVILFDGGTHEQDSHGYDFEIAAVHGFKAAAQQAGVELLEPIMIAEITCPEEFLGKITGDVNRRRGMITSIHESGQKQTVVAEVPLKETFGYISTVRTLTSGRGSVSLHMDSYKPVPQGILETIDV